MSKLADWIELKALYSDDRNASLQDLVAELRRDGSVEERGSDPGSKAGDAFSEIEDRVVAAGTGYPFIVDEQHIQLSPLVDVELSTYIFLLYMSYFGTSAGKSDQVYPERDFENISIEAARGYFGCNPHDGSYLFAFPRRTSEKNFSRAVDELSRLLHEGEGANPGPITGQQKDASLDLVVWHGFADKRAGQLIAFGQCTTARDWTHKVNDLPDPRDWCQAWMREPPTVSPVRMLFIPHRPDNDEWRIRSIFGGILFDRCRISYHTPKIPQKVVARCVRWVDSLKVNMYASQ